MSTYFGLEIFSLHFEKRKKPSLRPSLVLFDSYFVALLLKQHSTAISLVRDFFLVIALDVKSSTIAIVATSTL